jgi:hypothetical protein
MSGTPGDAGSQHAEVSVHRIVSGMKSPLQMYGTAGGVSKPPIPHTKKIQSSSVELEPQSDLQI